MDVREALKEEFDGEVESGQDQVPESATTSGTAQETAGSEEGKGGAPTDQV